MEKILSVILIIFILFALMVFGFNFLLWRSDYGCDIGKNETSGDYKITSSSWYDQWFNEKSCAIEDCSAYNKIQKENGSELRCVV